MIRRPPTTTPLYSSAASDGYKRRGQGSPVADALVRAIAGAETAPAAGTAITDAGGFFQIDGIDGGVYGIYGYKPGYYTQHTAGEVVHGTGRRNISLVMKRANPGKLTSIATTAPTPGGVLSLDRVTPIANIEVQARRLNPDGKTSVFSATSRYTSDARIPGLLKQTYASDETKG